jgi:hypothetical protein
MSGVMAENARRVRFLGTSWHQRGFEYLLRRALLSFTAFVVFFFWGFLYLALTLGALDASSKHPPVHAMVAIGSAVVLAWSTAAAFYDHRLVSAAEKANDVEALRAIVNTRARGRTGGGGLHGRPFAVKLLRLGLVAYIGWPIMVLVTSFRHYYSPEECLAALESGG